MQISELTRRINLSSKPGLAWQATAVLSVGILLGAASVRLGPILVLMGLIGVFVVYLAFMTPEIIILIILAFVLELIPFQLNLTFSLFIGHFILTDLLLVLLLTIVLVRFLADKAFHHVKTSLDIPLLLFCGSAIVGIVTAGWYHGIPFSYTTPEARNILYYLIFFVVTNLIRTRSQLTRLINGILLITVLVAGMMMIQVVFGRSYLIFQGWQVQGGELLRLYNPGAIVIYIALIVFICGMALRKDYRSRSVHYLLILLLGFSEVITLSRNDLVSGAIALALLVFILHKTELSQLAANLLIIASIALFIIAVFMLLGRGGLLLQYASAYFERSSRMFSSTILSSQENLLIRWEEIKYAWQQIMIHPILGNGFHTPYRPVFSEFENVSNTYYLHNAYLSIWLKTGLLGLISFLWLSFRFLRHGFQHWWVVKDNFLRVVTLGFTLAYLGLMINNIVGPTFVQDRSTMIFGVIMGVNIVALFQRDANTKFKQGEFQNVQT
jgi:O-antigen ligase